MKVWKKINDWNWASGSSIGIIKNSKDLDSLEKLVKQIEQNEHKLCREVYLEAVWQSQGILEKEGIKSFEEEYKKIKDL